MASTPKKLRTEKGSHTDEQPHTNEMSEGDEDPPVGEPRPKEESDIDVPPASPPPRLRMKGRKCVQFHMAKDAISTEEEEEPAAVRVVLLNLHWLNSFFDAEDFGAAQIFFTLGHTVLGKNCRRSVLFAMTAVGVTSLFRLSRNLTEIGIQWGNDPSGGTYARMHEWMRVALQLRVLPNLATISLIAGRLKHADAEFLVDSLPDRLIRVKTDNLRICTLLRKRMTPFELVEVIVEGGEHSYVADVFRVTSDRIDISSQPQEELSWLHLLHDCGPLAQNNYLRELYVEVEIFANDSIAQVLRHLRSINEHFNLVCHGDYAVSFAETCDLEQVEGIGEKAKEFAVTMGQAGFRSKSGELRIFVEDSENWQQVSHEQVFERLGWTRMGEIPWPEFSESLPTCFLVYEEVRILIGLDRV